MGILALRRRLIGGAVLLALAAAGTGCTFDRTVINRDVRDIDTSWIVPGRTTREEIVAKIGLPPTVKDVGIGISKNSMRWVSVDTYEKKFEAGYILTPTFSDSVGFYSHDLLITFDDAGTVTLVSRTKGNGEKVELVEWREVKR